MAKKVAAKKKSSASLAAAAGIDITGGEKPAASPDLLRNIKDLAEELRGIDSKLEDLEAQATKLNERRTEIVQQLLPERMVEAGMSDFSLITGEKVVVDDIVAGSIPTQNAIDNQKDPVTKAAMVARRSAAFAWLRKSNADGLIKTEVIAHFDKGQDKAAQQLLSNIKKAGIPAICDQTVHPQTLNKFLRETIANGKEVPVEPFALFTGKRASIKAPKQK